MWIKQLVCTSLVLMLVACASEPKVSELSKDDVIMDRLHRVTNSDAAVAYVDPNVDFSKYNRVMVDPLGVDNVEIIQPNTSNSASMRTRNSTWELSDADKNKLKSAFADAMRTQLQDKGSYPVVTAAADDVLRITTVLTALAPNAPPDDNKSRNFGRGQVYTEGAGSVYLSVGFVDSETGEILAVVKDVKTSRNHFGVNNSVTNFSDVKFMFGDWARAIRARLDIIHGD
jgi:hypothetical protein